MRLNREQVQVINQIVTRIAGESARVFLFGSRLDDNARGGDVDLLDEPDKQLLALPVDVLVHAQGTKASPFVDLARLKGRVLGDWP